MHCNKCGEKIEEDSAFCQFCGNKVAGNNTGQQANDSSREEDIESKSVKKSRADLLWEKFAEVYDADGADREKFNALSSQHVWELLERLSVNAFESFIQDNKEELNKQPYKTIEALKNVYIWTVDGGYKLWIAEVLLNDKKLDKFKSFSLEEFVVEWKKYDFDKAFKALSEEMSIGISRYSNFRFNSFIESAIEAKELSNATIENLKTSLLFQALNGYHAGQIENTFRK
ncbi:MAG: zinc ribbon domain-containing protein [Candidatus Levybacteria bacterium]|nr:zinc ribbon domain-containing protein [Candidatus Levybacteria bacterium]